jgi:LemA protein
LEKEENESAKLKGMNELDQMLTGQMKSLYAVAESYPVLKASEQFLHLQTRISALEDQIADRREFFNDSVNMYNTRIESLPDMFIAGMLNYKKKEMFIIEESETKVSAGFNK